MHQLPVITLNGDSLTEIGQNIPYTDAGATCEDLVDGPLAVITVGDIIDTSSLGSNQVTYDCQDTAGNDADTVTRTVNIISGTTLTVIVETDDSSSGTFDIKIENLTPNDTQSIATGTPFGPVSIISDTVIYTILQATPPSGYITGSSDCVIDGFSQGSQFTASPGDEVVCTSTFIASSTGGGDG